MKIIAHRKILLAIAGVVMAGSLGIILGLGLNLGIDFTGGALTEVAYEVRPDKTELESNLDTLNLGGYSLRKTTDEAGRGGYILRTRDLSESERIAVEEVMTAAGEGSDLTRFTSIGPVIGE